MISVPLLLNSSASAAPGDKVVVCKFVTTPGGTLHHIVVVADDSLPANWDGSTFPFEWIDAHGQTLEGSKAIRFADPGPPPEQAQDIDLSECGEGPVLPPPPADQRETRNLPPLLDCPSQTVTIIHEERTRSAVFVEGEWTFDNVDWSPWTEFDRTVTDATEQQCPPGEPINPPVVNPPAPPAPPAVNPPAPTLPATGSPALLSGLALMGALLLAAGSTLLMRSRKVRVPKA